MSVYWVVYHYLEAIVCTPAPPQKVHADDDSDNNDYDGDVPGNNWVSFI